MKTNSNFFVNIPRLLGNRFFCLSIFVLSYSTIIAQVGRERELKPLSVGTIALYHYTSASNGWFTFNDRKQMFDYKTNGYYFTKILGDTVINSKRYSIVYTSPRLANNQIGWLSVNIPKITYERQTDSSVYQFISGYDPIRRVYDYEREVFNFPRRSYSDFYCFSPPFPSQIIQNNENEFTIKCTSERLSSFYCEESFTIKKGFGVVQTAGIKQSSNLMDAEYYEDSSRFVGAISNGQVLGDSLVLFLDTDWNILDTARSKKIVLQNRISENPLNIIANITSNLLAIKIDNKIEQKIKIQIYNLLGQLVYDSALLQIDKYMNQLDVSIDYWRTGLYFIRVHSQEGVSTIKLLVRN
jgi:hypothetical protein